MKNKRKQWFVSRIGEKVYRSRNGCDCQECQNTYATGILIEDNVVADYLYEMEYIFNKEGVPLRYFDTKAEVEIYEKNLPNKSK